MIQELKKVTPIFFLINNNNNKNMRQKLMMSQKKHNDVKAIQSAAVTNQERSYSELNVSNYKLIISEHANKNCMKDVNKRFDRLN